MFDFSRFTSSKRTRDMEFLGLTADQTHALLNQDFGLSQTLLEQYPDLTKRGEQPNSPMKCLIVWESNGRNATYAVIATATGITEDSAYQQCSKARKWIKAAFNLNVDHKGDSMFLVTNETLAEKSERLEAQFQKVEKAILNLDSDVKSIRQTGNVPVLPPRAAAVLGGYQQAAQLTAGEEPATTVYAEVA